MRGDANRPTAPTRTIGSGYRPTVWCPNCHCPYDAALTACPECEAPTERPLLRPIPTSTQAARRAARGLGTIVALRSGRAVSTRLFRLEPDPGTCLDCGAPAETMACVPCVEGRR